MAVRSQGSCGLIMYMYNVHASIRASFRTLFRGHKREYQSKGGGGGSRGMLPQENSL